MDNIIDEVFDEVLVESEDGIELNNINLKFHTLEKYSISSSYNDSVPVLIIKNRKEIVNKLKRYIELIIEVKKLEVNKENIKKCLILLFSNACYEDFSNPSKFIDNYINFYLNNEFMANQRIMNDIKMKRITLPISKETPYSFKSIICNDDNKYYLPNINYGISEDVCYIYSMEQTTTNSNQEYNEQVEAKYDTNLLALSLLIKELYNYGISKIKVVSCLPMRYSKKEQIEVQKLLEDFTSLNYMFSNVVVMSNPFEKDEYMNISIQPFNGEGRSNFNELLTLDSKLYIEKTI